MKVSAEMMASDNMVACICREIAQAAADEGEATGVIAVGDAATPLFKLLVTGKRLPDGMVEVDVKRMEMAS